MPSLKFPSVGLQVLSSLIHFLGVSILSHCISRRLAAYNILRNGFKSITWARFCILAVLVDSWFFLFLSGVLIFGFGLELVAGVCTAGVFTCILLYAASKFFIYAFLIERVHVVWSSATQTKRFQSRLYILCFVTVLAYLAVVGLMVLGRDNYFRPDDMVCIIGLKEVGAYPLLIYDLYINVFLTSLFLYGLRRGSATNARTRKIARRALIAAVIALTTSTTNIAILAVVHGKELGWLCLGSCGTDVVINALSIFWATGNPRRQTVNTQVGDLQTRNESPRSILKQPSSAVVAFSPSETHYPSGPHRITSTYYQCRDVSMAPSETLISVDTRPPQKDPALNPSKLARVGVLSDLGMKFQTPTPSFDDDEEPAEHQITISSSDIEISSVVYGPSTDEYEHHHPFDGSTAV